MIYFERMLVLRQAEFIEQFLTKSDREIVKFSREYGIDNGRGTTVKTSLRTCLHHLVIYRNPQLFLERCGIDYWAEET